MRIKCGVTTRKRRKKILKRAKGYFGSKHALFRTAREQLLHSGQYSFIGRKKLKNDFRSLWIIRINNACRLNGITYKELMHMIKKTETKINRKMLSEIAIYDMDLFSNLIKQIKEKFSNLPSESEKNKKTQKNKKIQKTKIN